MEQRTHETKSRTRISALTGLRSTGIDNRLMRIPRDDQLTPRLHHPKVATQPNRSNSRVTRYVDPKHPSLPLLCWRPIERARMETPRAHNRNPNAAESQNKHGFMVGRRGRTHQPSGDLHPSNGVPLRLALALRRVVQGRLARPENHRRYFSVKHRMFGTEKNSRGIYSGSAAEQMHHRRWH